MSTDKKNIGKVIICKRCGHRVGVLRIKPELKELLKKRGRQETFIWIMAVALVTQVIAQVISDWIFGLI